MTDADFRIHSAGDAGAVTIFLPESDFYLVIGFGCDLHGFKLTCSTCWDCRMCDQLGIGMGGRDGTSSYVCGFCEHSPYDYSLVEKSLAAFAIFQGHDQDSPEAHQMSSPEMTLRHLPFEMEWLPEPSIQSSRTSSLSHGRSRPRLPSLVASIRPGSSASARNAPCATVLFQRLCPSPT